jgi:septal ring factor EnvC (AmiA/AmiB activator)
MKAKEIEEIQKRLAENNAEINKLKGKEEALLAQLKKLGFNNSEKAEEELEALSNAEDGLQEECSKIEDKLQKKYPELF